MPKFTFITMNLCIDFGNTLTKYFVFENNRLIDFSPHFPIQFLPEIKKAIISASGKIQPETEKILKKHSIPFIYNNHNLKFPFSIDYETPTTLGPDRLALVSGALNKTEPPCLIVDAGTCVTYDFIDARKHYLGGAISPGLTLRYKSLSDYTASLPLLPVPDDNPALIGKSTRSSIHSGVYNGWLAEAEGIIRQYSKQYPGLKIIITGGDGERLAKSIKISIFAFDKFLQAYGLNEILNLNL